MEVKYKKTKKKESKRKRNRKEKKEKTVWVKILLSQISSGTLLIIHKATRKQTFREIYFMM